MTAKEAETLLHAIYRIVAIAVDCNDRHIDFPSDWLFHFRWGKGKKESAKINGETVRFMTVGGRTTAVVSKKKNDGFKVDHVSINNSSSSELGPSKKKSENVGSKRKKPQEEKIGVRSSRIRT